MAIRIVPSLFPKSLRQTLSAARSLSAGPKRSEVGKSTCWVRTVMNINERV